MKRVTMTPQPKRLALLIAGIGLAMGTQAAAQQDVRGKMVDVSRTEAAAMPSSSEREDAAFGVLAPSALTRTERVRVLQASPPAEPPRHSVSMRDALDGANFESGRARLLPAGVTRLEQLAARLKDKRNVRIAAVGHTDNQRIAARLRPLYPDNQALSEARALAVVSWFKAALQLDAAAFSASGRGAREPVADNGTPAGMASNRRTEIEVWYEDAASQESAAAPLPAPVAADTLRESANECEAPRAAPQPFSISVDGKPLHADTSQQEADRQRCVDVALNQASIEVRYDPMTVAPALNVWVAEKAPVRGAPLTFVTYTNYAWWQKRAEIRVFGAGQDTASTPLAVVPVAVGGVAQWNAPPDAPSDMRYLLRVSDAEGRFDETASRSLRPLERAPAASVQAAPQAHWGENTLKLSNIPASGGTVSVSGSRVAPGQQVRALGMVVPVDAKGKFALRQILPAGPHTVAVTVSDPDGAAYTLKRNLSIADRDWFYIAVADLSAGRDNTDGPAQLVTADATHYNNKSWIDGRGAFYVKGKMRGDILLTASADTREQPLRDLFDNFQSKDPSYLLRRIDPDRYYPVYGDDSTIADDAPTAGKLYVRLAREDASVMWGNFQSAWSGTELTQFNRGLYGANLSWKSAQAAPTGEKRSSVNVFAAEPGTMPSREEFRGTGGSLYYLRQQDLTQGSERLWVETRDRDSGLVLARTALAASSDYEINYLQGRLTLREPLASVGGAGTLVQSGAASGNPQFLVATYEYVPGLSRIDGSVAGLRARHWFNDHLQLGLSAYHQGDGVAAQDLKGLDGLLRYRPNTWIKAEAARSDGAGAASLSSVSGGFDFQQAAAGGQRAGARRVEAAADLADLGGAMRGVVSAYWQEREAGFSGPGQLTANGEAMRQSGMAAVLPLGALTEVALKADQRAALTQDARAFELALRRKLDAEWGVAAGIRHDERDNGVAQPGASAILNQSGARNDAVIRVDYRPLRSGQQGMHGKLELGAVTAGGAAPASALMSGAAPAVGAAVPLARGGDADSAAGIAAARMAGLEYEPWDLYGYAQHTLSRSGQRGENDRAGVGASWRVNERLRLGAEVSGGDGGAGGRLSGTLRTSERSDIYLAYSMETESEDVYYGGRQGKLTGGTHYRLSEGAALFAETRWQDGAGPQSLTHAFGVDLSPGADWSFGLKAETGTLSDPLAGDVKRNAIGLSAGYSNGNTRFSSALEYRTDKTDALTNHSERRSWLSKNSLGMQLDPAWRMLAKLNLSRSVASQGAFFDGDFTEAVLGMAYRPVANDRWNGLLKYTYFYNLPSPGQVDAVMNRPLDFTQKSHVFNADGIVDVNPWLSLGAKYAIRIGELRPGKVSGDWFSSRADLAVLRADLHLVKEWDGLAEVRRLDAREARDVRSGALLGIYRKLGQHAKIGVGYNFTDFSDDLTDMSYRSRGWFVNALGTF